MRPLAFAWDMFSREQSLKDNVVIMILRSPSIVSNNSISSSKLGVNECSSLRFSNLKLGFIETSKTTD